MSLKISPNYSTVNFSKIAKVILFCAVFTSGTASGYQFAPVVIGNTTFPKQTDKITPDKTPRSISSNDGIKPDPQTTTSTQENLPQHIPARPAAPQTQAAPITTVDAPNNPIPPQNEPPAVPPPAEEPTPPPTDPPPTDPPDDPPQNP